MNAKKNLKYFIPFLIIVGVVVYLVSTTFQSSLEYYVTVSELRANELEYKDETLKVAGKAAEVKRVETGTKLAYQFQIVEGGKVIDVYYDGFAPDTFKEGADVVATGYMEEDGSFRATHLLAKCASKYEAKIE